MTATASIGHLRAELADLDARLAVVLEERRQRRLDRSDDPLAGVVVRPTHAAAALAARSGSTVARRPDRAALDAAAAGTLLADLWERFGLGPFERFVTVLAVAPELDARYAPVLAFLQDDTGARRPTVALAAELWYGPGLDGVAARAAFAPDSALRASGLVALAVQPGEGPLLEQQLVADEWLVERALGRDRLDASLRPWVRRQAPPEGPSKAAPATPIVVRSADVDAAVDAAVAMVGPALVAVPVLDAAVGAEVFAALCRDARAAGTAVVVAAALVPDDAGGLAAVEALAASGVPVTVVGDAEATSRLPLTWRRHDVPAADADLRARRWRWRLTEQGFDADDGAVSTVAFAHPMPLGAIDAAVAGMGGPNGSTAVDTGRLRAAARSATGRGLARLTRRVETTATWDDIVLAPEAIGGLRDIARAIDARRQVLDDWGFGNRPGGRGMSLLFAGPSGTGKTLAAAVLARAAGYELRSCDVARVVDKYIGETEKRLDDVLKEAEAANCVLLFDEADALFGRRAEVRDARDRYANLEVAYLLQRIEQHDGITVLATNLGQHLDEAFARRLHHRIDFHPPDAGLRRQLWRRLLPESAPLALDVDLDAVADNVELTGGAIRNAALAAAYLAAADGRAIGNDDLLRAVVRELEKLGRQPSRAELVAITGKGS